MTAQGYEFRLITNADDLLRARFAALGVPSPELVKHHFTRVIPPMPFRAAHRKLELFAAFATGAFGPAVALIDIDTLLLRGWPFAIEPGALLGYDIGPHTTPAVIANDLSWAGVAGTTRWWGGEFLAGDAAAFRPLAKAVERLWPRYLAAVPTLCHVGDETMTTAALAALTVRDVGGEGVQRWWSSRTKVRQQASSREALTAALVHLPADKAILGRYADPAVSLDGFPSAYRRHVAAKLPVRLLAGVADRLRGRPIQYLPRLGR